MANQVEYVKITDVYIARFCFIVGEAGQGECVSVMSMSVYYV